MKTFKINYFQCNIFVFGSLKYEIKLEVVVSNKFKLNYYNKSKATESS